MNSARLIRLTAAMSNVIFRHAPSVYSALYDPYKRRIERGNIALVRRCVAPGHRVVDIGANIGFYTQLLADCVGPTGSVHAFEPDPVNYARLVERVRGYPQVRVQRTAITEASGTVSLHRSPNINVDHRTYPTGEARETIDVPAAALDDVFRGDPGGIDFLKMDIQGAEHQALLGMSDLIARSPRVHILMELWPYAFERVGTGVDAVLGLFDAWGLEVRRVEGREGRLGERLTPGMPFPERSDPDAYFDVLCTRPTQPRIEALR